MIFFNFVFCILHITDNWKPYRFRQFYLDVSNSSATTTETRIRCYTDNTTNTSTPSIPPNKLSMPCNQIARYVIVETMYDAPDDSPTTGPILEICEIEVNGKWYFPLSLFLQMFKIKISCRLCVRCLTLKAIMKIFKMIWLFFLNEQIRDTPSILPPPPPPKEKINSPKSLKI